METLKLASKFTIDELIKFILSNSKDKSIGVKLHYEFLKEQFGSFLKDELSCHIIDDEILMETWSESYHNGSISEEASRTVKLKELPENVYNDVLCQLYQKCFKINEKLEEQQRLNYFYNRVYERIKFANISSLID